MRLDFTQGLVRYQKELNGNLPKFLQINNNNDGYVDLVAYPDPTIIVFAHRSKNYIIEENQSIEQAWGPFPAHGESQFLFWDINFASGELTRGWTKLTPVISTQAPPNPAQDQHWFDTANRVMNVWNGHKWTEKIRVFAGIYDQTAVLAAKMVGTQVGLKDIVVFAGHIILGTNGSPLRDVDGTFLTTETELIVARNSSTNVKFEAISAFAQASESIPKFHLVSYTGIKTLALASYLQADRQVNGIVREHLYQGEVGHVVTSGPIKNDAWAWNPADIGKPVFCGPTGQVTRSVPPAGVVQQVGIISDVDEIYMWLMPPVVL